MDSTARGGNFFEDFAVGQTLRHAVPRTIHGGDLSMYISLTGDRGGLGSSTEFARSLGFRREVVFDLLVFHIVFGKTVSDISLNAVANLGYSAVQFLRPVYPGDTLQAESEVIGLRETSSGNAGIVYVTSRGINQRSEEVLRFHRWVLVHKKNAAVTGVNTVPVLPKEVLASELPVFSALNMERFDDVAWAMGRANGVRRWDDYSVGETLYHPGGMTLEESEHMMATRLYQNTAHVHFDGHAMANSRFGKRLVYGGHVISLAFAQARSQFPSVLHTAAWNSGTHANPFFAGDTLYSFTEVKDKVRLPLHPGLGGLRLRLVATKNLDSAATPLSVQQIDDKGKKKYHPNVVLDLDYWAILPM